MVELLKEKINNLNENYPDWVQAAFVYFEGGKESEDKGATVAFLETVDEACTVIKREACTADAAVALFPAELATPLSDLLKRCLRPYYASVVARRLWPTQRTHVESLLDDMWPQRVVRYNPAYRVEVGLREKLDVSDDDLYEFIRTISAVVDHCISRLLSYDATVAVIHEQTQAPTDFCEYLARKVDRDFETLRVNYLVKVLRNRYA